MQFGNIRVSTGLQLHYAEVGGDDDQAIVFLHGWPDSWFSFSRLLPLLPTGFRMLALDQRGFGDSERPSSGYRIHDFADDVAAFCGALSLRSVTVVGHSFGTFVARRVAAAYPELVRRLVLIGSGFTASNPVTREVQASIRDLPESVPAE